MNSLNALPSACLYDMRRHFGQYDQHAQLESFRILIPEKKISPYCQYIYRKPFTDFSKATKWLPLRAMRKVRQPGSSSLLANLVKGAVSSIRRSSKPGFACSWGMTFVFTETTASKIAHLHKHYYIFGKSCWGRAHRRGGSTSDGADWDCGELKRYKSTTSESLPLSAPKSAEGLLRWACF